ncbi:MAG: YkgJ family cysteine cluster protein [Chloroflexi bacterium]|nr:YkgJ family cysteine cluster protein [Chloroflexota bacterium]
MNDQIYSIDLAFIAAEAVRRAEDYDAFRYFVELDERTDAELDTLVEKIAAPIIAAIDCKQCANCCRSLDVYLTENDAQHLANGTFIPLEQLLTEQIDCDRAAENEEWGVFRQKPCQFLSGKLCGVYEHRPESCRMYPVFTPDFRWTLDEILGGVGLCPIIYHTIEQLQQALGW